MNDETMLKPPEPHRRFEVQIRVGGDTLEDALEMVREFADKMEAGQAGCVTGGCSAGGYYRVNEDTTVTHDSYFAAINERKDRNDP